MAARDAESAAAHSPPDCDRGKVRRLDGSDWSGGPAVRSRVGGSGPVPRRGRLRGGRGRAAGAARTKRGRRAQDWLCVPGIFSDEAAGRQDEDGLSAVPVQ